MKAKIIKSPSLTYFFITLLAVFMCLLQKSYSKIEVYNFSGVFELHGGWIPGDEEEEEILEPFVGFIQIDTDAEPSTENIYEEGGYRMWYDKPNFRIYIKTQSGLEHDSDVPYFQTRRQSFISFDEVYRRLDAFEDYQLNHHGRRHSFRKVVLRTSEYPPHAGASPLHGDFEPEIPNPWNLEDYSDIRLEFRSYIRGANTFGLREDFNLVTASLDTWEKVSSGPLDTLTEVSDSLEEVNPVDKHAQKELAKALEHLDKALAEELWVDDINLTEEGKDVFKEIEKVAKSLKKLAKDMPELMSYFEEINQILVDVSRELAQNILDKAIESGVDEKKIQHIEKEMLKADKEVSKNKIHQAIHHYRHAWKDAFKELEGLL